MRASSVTGVAYAATPQRPTVSLETVATILGSPDFAGSPYRDHRPDQLAALKELGVNTVFVNMAWSRPLLDAVTLEEVVIGQTFPTLSDAGLVAINQPRLRRRIDAITAAGLRPFFLFGCPKQLNPQALPADVSGGASDLLGSRTSHIDPRLAVACIQSTAVREHYRELLTAHFAHFPETAGLLFYTMDELAEVCDELDDCPRCHGVPVEERLPDFLLFLRGVVDDLKAGVEIWWEPWEFTASQTYAVVERLDPSITLALHSCIHEVYFTNQADTWFRHLSRIAADRGIRVVAELFFSGSGEDLGPVPAYPCPRLVHEQLRSLAASPAVTGFKEYYGTVVEHLGVNERVMHTLIRDPDRPSAQVVAELADEFGSRAAPALLAGWEAASRALELFPWALSWRMRQYTTVRYDHLPDGGYWDSAFTALLLTPWTTPSWESSRQAAYIVSSSDAVVGERLLDETARQLEGCRQQLETAADHVHSALILLGDSSGARGAELQRQLLSLQIFRCLTLACLYRLDAERLLTVRRGGRGAAWIPQLRACLANDLQNARFLLGLVAARADHAINIATLRVTITEMERELDDYDRDPASWATTHFRRG